jgi:hypothetical protein
MFLSNNDWFYNRLYQYNVIRKKKLRFYHRIRATAVADMEKVMEKVAEINKSFIQQNISGIKDREMQARIKKPLQLKDFLDEHYLYITFHTNFTDGFDMALPVYTEMLFSYHKPVRKQVKKEVYLNIRNVFNLQDDKITSIDTEIKTNFVHIQKDYSIDYLLLEDTGI